MIIRALRADLQAVVFDAFSPEAMREGYAEHIEGALWTAVRVLEESASLERRLAGEATTRGDQLTADRFSDIATGREEQASPLREMLMSKQHGEQNVSRRSRVYNMRFSVED